MDRVFKRPFISQDWESCQFPFVLVLDEKSTVCRSARPESSREVRKRCLMAPFARTQSEPRRRLALASGFALFRSFGIDRLDEVRSGVHPRAIGRGDLGDAGSVLSRLANRLARPQVQPFVPVVDRRPSPCSSVYVAPSAVIATSSS